MLRGSHAREVNIPYRQRVRATGDPAPRIAESRGATAPTSLPLLWLYGVWAITLLDLQFFLGNVVASPFLRLATVAYVPLLVAMVIQGPMILGFGRGGLWYPPFLLLLLAAVLSLPAAVNLGVAKENIQILVVYYALAVATTLYVRRARQALPIIVMLFGQFVWWAIWGRAGGLISWSPTLSNLDGFGALMVQGAGICFWCAMAARSRRLKALLFALAGYCVMGVVASYARGAFLSLVALAALIWVRSPRKLLTAAAFLLGAVIIIGAAALLFDKGFFWAEITSSFTEGTSTGTGGLRWALWTTALRVFAQHPIFGVAPGNFGAFASTFVQAGEVPAFPEPIMFYGQNLHNSYLQVLSELGLVGVIAFVWLVVDFFRRNRALREAGAVERWAQTTGGKFDLRYLALGLEAVNAANLLAGLLYASLFMPWFWTTWTANRMLWAVTRPSGPAAAVPKQRATGTSARRNHRG